MKKFLLSLVVIFSCSFSFSAFSAITPSCSGTSIYVSSSFTFKTGSSSTSCAGGWGTQPANKCVQINKNCGSLTYIGSISFPPTCPSNSTLNGSSCTCNSGYEEQNGSCVLSCDLSTHEMVGGVCTPRCLDQQIRNSAGVCEDPPPEICVKDKLVVRGATFSYISASQPADNTTEPLTVCHNGCEATYEKGIYSFIYSGKPTHCVALSATFPSQVVCTSYYRENGIGCFVPYPNQHPVNCPVGGCTPSKPTGQPLNNDGSIDYDGNPATSGKNEPGAPGSNLNLDGTPNNDGDPRTNDGGGSSGNEPPCTGLDCAPTEQNCTSGTAWDGTACTCGAHSPHYDSATGLCTQTACNASSPNWNPELNSCDPSPVCDPAVEDCVSVGDKDKLAGLDQGNADIMDLITSTPDDFKFFDYPDFVPVFNKQACQPFTGHILGKPITWDVCPYVEMLNQVIGWLMTLFSLYTMVQIGIKKD